MIWWIPLSLKPIRINNSPNQSTIPSKNRERKLQYAKNLFHSIVTTPRFGGRAKCTRVPANTTDCLLKFISPLETSRRRCMCIGATVPTENHSKDASSASAGYLSKPIISFLAGSPYMCYGRNQHRSDINIHYIPNDSRSPDLESCCQPPPSSSSSSSVRSWSNGTSAYRFVIYGESLVSRLSDEARAATVGDSSFGSPHPAAATSSTSQDLPDFRYLSFRHSLGLVESPFSPGWVRSAITIPKSWFCERANLPCRFVRREQNDALWL